jgi:hypothetical protein
MPITFRESDLEKSFVKALENLKYEPRPDIHDRAGGKRTRFINVDSRSHVDHEAVTPSEQIE